MHIAVDFDDTLITSTASWETVFPPVLAWIPGAREGLLALQRAGHVLVLYSARANRASRFNPDLDPLLPSMTDEQRRELQVRSEALYRQMVGFVAREVPGVFAYVDEGAQGKPRVDLFIDDRAVQVSGQYSWASIVRRYGESAQ